MLPVECSKVNKARLLPKPRTLWYHGNIPKMVNHCIRLGLEKNVTTLKKFSSLFYHELDHYQVQSKYKLTAMSQACGRLSQRRQTTKKGIVARSPYVRRPYLVSCYGFKINGMLMSFPLGNGKFMNIILNDHTVSELSKKGIEPRSFSHSKLIINLRAKASQGDYSRKCNRP